MITEEDYERDDFGFLNEIDETITEVKGVRVGDILIVDFKMDARMEVLGFDRNTEMPIVKFLEIKYHDGETPEDDDEFTPGDITYWGYDDFANLKRERNG
jgi:hypothetical protein